MRDPVRLPLLRIPVRRAEQYAQQFVRLIGDACDRIEVAGSVRRQLPQVGEITVVVVPKVLQQGNLFGDDLPSRDLVIETIDRLVSRGRLAVRSGDRGRKTWTATHREMAFRTDDGKMIPVDVWWTTRAHWGVQLALRTGPAALAYALTAPLGAVTSTGRAGLLPTDLRIRDGLQQAIGTNSDGTLTWEDVATPEEADFLALVGYDRPPEDRR
jgi:hypothetical protein